MGEMTKIVELLQEQRRALVEQLEAVDKAIAALHAADAVDDDDAGAVDDDDAGAVDDDDADAIDEPGAEETPAGARHVKARRTQTDTHKHAIAIGKRNARNARDASKGLMRDIQGDDFIPAINSRGDQNAPRLVKKKI